MHAKRLLRTPCTHTIVCVPSDVCAMVNTSGLTRQHTSLGTNNLDLLIRGTIQGTSIFSSATYSLLSSSGSIAVCCCIGGLEHYSCTGKRACKMLPYPCSYTCACDPSDVCAMVNTFSVTWPYYHMGRCGLLLRGYQSTVLKGMQAS